MVSPYIEKYGWIFPQRVEVKDKIIIDKIVLFSCYEDSISLEACFSCYQKSFSIIIRALSFLNDCKLIKYLYYGTTQFDQKELTPEKFFAELNTIYQNRYDYFKANYTTKEVEVLPHQFYRYYNKHRKELKQK